MKERLDILLVKKGFCSSRERAKKNILNGQVTVDGVTADKPGVTFSEDAVITVSGEDRYVGRGGYKLEKALSEFGITLSGTVCMDIGASTGGFTDCMLQNGAAKVYAVDVGTAQLAESLQKDPRVVSMEQTDIRSLTDKDLPEPVGFLAVDLSFISLTKVFPALAGLLREGGRMVCLIKPQFEAGREHIGKNGIVKDRKVHRMVIDAVLTEVAAQGFRPEGITFSPICGGSGNIEYLFSAVRAEAGTGSGITDSERIVNEAFLYHRKQGKGS